MFLPNFTLFIAFLYVYDYNVYGPEDFWHNKYWNW